MSYFIVKFYIHVFPEQIVFHRKALSVSVRSNTKEKEFIPQKEEVKNRTERKIVKNERGM